MTIADSIS